MSIRPTPRPSNNGFYITLNGVSYQLQISRELNQFSTEDSQYLVGLPRGTKALTSAQLWYGVFLWAHNPTNQAKTLANSFAISDTEGNKYYPVKLNPAVNQWVWTGTPLGPNESAPGPDTTASEGPTGGGLVLFKLPTSIYSNRPLTLFIYGAGKTPGTISLDL